MAQNDEKEVVFEVPHKKTTKEDKVILTVKMRDIPEVDPKDVIACIKVNTQKEEEKVEEAEEKKTVKPRIIAKILIPVVIIGVALGSCKHTDDVKKEYSVPINGIVYEVDNPSVDEWGILGNAGQEAMTNDSTFEEHNYDYRKQAQEESEAISRSR